MYEWLEKIVYDFCEDQAIEERTLLYNVKIQFYDGMHERFLCIVLKLLHKFLIDKGVACIVESRLPLSTLACTS